MKKERKDFTEYFKYLYFYVRCLHSEQAEKVLKSFPVVSKAQPSKNSIEYDKMYEKVHHLFEPLWDCEAALSITLFCTMMIACTTQSAIVSILLFAFTQVVSGWVGHSMAHNRHPWFMKYGRITAGITGGFSL